MVDSQKLMTPILFLQSWLIGLLSLGLAGGAAWCAYEWQRRSWEWLPLAREWVFSPSLTWDGPTALLAAAVVLTTLVFFGKEAVRAIHRIMRKAPQHDHRSNPYLALEPVERRRLTRPDGSEIEVSLFGPEAGIPVVLSHGWGLHGAVWNALVRRLAGRFRVIVWDEPGLGRSRRPGNGDFSLEKLAADLLTVLQNTAERPAVLLGHSIGGMMTLTFCGLFAQVLERRVAGLVLVHTTPTDPVKTTKGASFYTEIEEPVLRPLMRLAVFLSPMLAVLNWLSYRNGSAHVSTIRSSFGGTETWEMVDFATRFQLVAPPAVVARGMLGMMHYDAEPILEGISVPTLVVAGDRDAVTKPEASVHLANVIPDARLLSLTPAKHLGLIEHENTFADAVTEFVHHATARYIAQHLHPDVSEVEEAGAAEGTRNEEPERVVTVVQAQGLKPRRRRGGGSQ